MSAHWAALLTDDVCDSSLRIDPHGIAVWALQFTPRVAKLDHAVLLEVEQSLRLFGGEENVRQLVEAGATELGVARLAWAPTSLAALACARVGFHDGFAGPLTSVLDPLPFECIDAVKAHGATLARLGCRTLADVRKLPRGGISRRFDSQLLLALGELARDVFCQAGVARTRGHRTGPDVWRPALAGANRWLAQRPALRCNRIYLALVPRQHALQRCR
jgi:protein ImuB